MTSRRHGSRDSAANLGVMTPELWERLNSLFSEAIDRPVPERRAFVAKVCGKDKVLRRELLALVEAHERQASVTGGIADEIRKMVGQDGPRVFEPGDTLLDRFKILEVLGSGGMGDVYKAMDTELGQTVALKMIRPEIARNDIILTRFKREVQLARRLSGPNLCRIYELFLLKDSRGKTYGAFLTMEFLEGITLAEKLQHGPLPFAEAQAIAFDICAGLGTMHRAGIVHRDIKSRNIMIANRDGVTRAVLMDFGLAREVMGAGLAEDGGITMPGVVLGTPAYMAPEQFEGKPVTPATDVYSAGVVLYELVTGKNPFAGSNLARGAILRRLKPDPTLSLPHGLPGRWDRAIRRCIELDPARRFQSADELARALRPGVDLGSLRRPSKAALVSLAASIALLASAWFVPPVRESVQGLVLADRDKHIVVLPFDVSADSKEFALLGDGLVESLTGKLSNLDTEHKGLWVVPASEVRRRRVADPSSAYREFGATMVVKGRFTREDGTVRLNLELIDSKRMRQIGYADVENSAQDLASFENQVIASLGRLMDISTRGEGAEKSGVSSSAYQQYIAALGYLQRFDKPGHLDNAIGSLHRAIKESPKFPLAMSHLCHAYTLKYQIQLDPDSLNQAQQACANALDLDSRIPGTYAALASLHRITGQAELAAQEYQHVIDLDPNNVNAVQGMAHIYEQQGRFADAERAFTRATELRPADWQGYNELGNFYDRNGRHREAIAPLQHALQLTPDNSVALCNLANVYLNSGDPALFPEAEKAFRRSIAISPTYQARAGLGTLYGQEGKFEQAAAQSEEALRLDDQDYAVWFNLMQAYEGIPDSKKAEDARKQAIAHAERALITNTNNADAHAELAQGMARDGRREAALEHIHSALARAPNDLYVLAEVADAYEVLGERTLAIQYLKQAIANGFPRIQINGDVVLKRVSADPRFRLQ